MTKFNFEYQHDIISLIPFIVVDLENVAILIGWLFWGLTFYPNGIEDF